MNVWKWFAGLTGQTRLQVARVVSFDGSESVVADHGGRQYRAIGTGVAVGKMAYIKDGAIQTEAPDLTDIGIQYV